MDVMDPMDLMDLVDSKDRPLSIKNIHVSIYNHRSTHTPYNKEMRGDNHRFIYFLLAFTLVILKQSIKETKE